MLSLKQEKSMSNSDKLNGGKIRAENLSPVRRKEIAELAAMERWHKETPRATHIGILTIGKIEIPCAVLKDGKRLLSENAVVNSLGGVSGGMERSRKKSIEEGLPLLPVFLAQNTLKPFISADLISSLLSPIEYVHAGKIVKGFPAEILPQICEVWLNARDSKALLRNQLEKAKKAEILMRGLAQVGIIALVDSATGYEEIRDKNALEKILDLYISKEFSAWAKRFPDEFYKEIFRLRRWEWKGMSVNRPQLIGKYTNDLVYDRLAPEILEELSQKNPKDSTNRRKVCHHQFLTDDIGHPKLEKHIHGLLMLMGVSEEWKDFMEKVNLVIPKKKIEELE